MSAPYLMSEVKNVQYRSPVRGNDSTNPLYTEDSSAASPGGNKTTFTADIVSRVLLQEILAELKKINLRQDIVFDETISDGDVK